MAYNEGHFEMVASSAHRAAADIIHNCIWRKIETSCLSACKGGVALRRGERKQGLSVIRLPSDSQTIARFVVESQGICCNAVADVTSKQFFALFAIFVFVM